MSCENEELLEQVDSLDNALKASKEELMKSSKMAGKLLDLETNVEALKKQNNALDSENKELKAKIICLEETSSGCHEKVKSLEQNLKEKDLSIHNLNEQVEKISELEKVITERDALIDSYNIEKSEFIAKLEANKNQMDVLIQQHKVLKEKLAENEATDASAEAYESKIEELKTELCLKVAEIENYKIATSDLDDKLRDQTSEMNKLKEEVELKNKEIGRLQTRWESNKENMEEELSKKQELNSAELSKTIEKYENHLGEKEQQLKSRDDEINALSIQMKSVQYELESWKDSYSKLKKVGEEKEAELNEAILAAEKIQLEQGKKSESDEVMTLTQKLNHAESEWSKVVKHNEDLMDAVAHLKSQIAEARDQNLNFKQNLSKLCNDCSAMKQSLLCLSKSFGETQGNTLQDMLSINYLFNELNTKVVDQESHKSELLDEIREMNSELKKRGTKISDQEEAMSRLNDQLKAAETEINSLKDMNNSSLLSNRSTTDEGHTEAMSTSTVSKVEEATRMADVESSFEDR